ncbi:MAG: PaaI family thioesterase [Candidatus Eisenbacteria bacterium]|nr:PaaI family thioesterase [Candidatus Eisenbacteria bacterium]
MAGLNLSDDSMCFCCGQENEEGLKLEFHQEGDETVTRFSYPKRFQGYRDIVHGGLIATVLDEAMVTLLNERGHLAVTGDLSVRFLRPLPVETPVEIRARLVASRRNLFKLAATAVLEDGTEVARARSTFLSTGSEAG